MDVVVHRDRQQLAENAASMLAALVGDPNRPRTSLGLSGGSTPAETYRLLRGLASGWDRVDAWLSDERWVPHEHKDCNGAMVADLLMDHVAARFHRPRWASWITASDSAAHYEATLRSIHPDGRADLILLGMGDDGHTASLFPDSPALEANPGRWYVANEIPSLGVERLTATYTFIHRAHRVVFLVCGKEKAETLRSVLEPRSGQPVLPARRVMDGEAEVTWLVDADAAAGLTDTPLVTAD